MRRSMVAGVALALGMGYSVAQAEVVTFDFLLDGGSISAADKVFSGFVVDNVVAAGAGVALPNYTLIDVLSLDDGGFEPGPGLRFEFNDQLTVAGVTDPNPDGLELLEFIDLTFSFSVTSLGSPIKDNSLLLDAELEDPQLDVAAFVLEQVFATDGQQIASKTAERSFLDLGGPPIEVDDPTDFAVFDPQQSIRVSKNIFVGASVDDEVADVIAVEQRFSQVPIPATAMLLGLGLVGLFVVRRRRP
jgi:hypothetical protein